MIISRLSMLVISAAVLGGASSSHAAPAPAADEIVAAPVIDAPVTDEPEDEGESGSEEWTDSEEDTAEPGDAKAGDTLYHVSWYGHGLTTIVADIAFARQYSKVEKACKDAGGELKNVKLSTSGIFYYYNYGTADCVKK